MTVPTDADQPDPDRGRPLGHPFHVYVLVILIVAAVGVGLVVALMPRSNTVILNPVPGEGCPPATGSRATPAPIHPVTTSPVLADTAAPEQMVMGPDNHLWFGEAGANKVGTIDPGTGHLTEYATQGGVLGIAVGPDGRLWFTEPSTDRVGAITTAGVLNEYTITAPFGIAAGPDHNLWVTQLNANAIAVVSIAGVQLHQYPLPVDHGSPWAIVLGSDNNLWFTEFGVAAVGRISPTGVESQLANGQIHNAFNLISGPNHEIWISEEASSLFPASTNNGATGGGPQIARVDTAGNLIQQISLPDTVVFPIISAVDPGGFVWVANATRQDRPHAGPAFEEIAPGGQICRLITDIQTASPVWFVAGPGGAMYYTAQTYISASQSTTSGAAIGKVG